MKKHFTFICLIIFTLHSCSVSNIINKTLEKSNVYSDEIDYKIELKNNIKVLKLIPIRHLGTPKFYDNLNNLITEHQNMGYTVYYELLKTKNADDITIRKFRKITSLKLNVDDTNLINYKDLLYEKIRKIDENFEFKKEVTPQPSYEYLIADMDNAINVDISSEQFVSVYERMYGEVKLDSCDYVNDWNKSSCFKSRKKNIDKIIIDYRNNHVIEYIINSNNNKILVLYGENHITGIKKGLVKKGYKVLNLK